MPLEKQGHVLGIIDAFVEKIPVNIRTTIQDQIPRDVTKNCNGSFEEFLKTYFEAVAKFIVESRKTQSLTDIIYRRRKKTQEMIRETKKNRI